MLIEEPMTTQEKIKALQEQYAKYFSPLSHYDENIFFEQVTTYKDFTTTYTSDSTREITNA